MDNVEVHRRLRRFRRLTAALVLALILFGLLDVRRRARVDTGNPETHRTDITIFTGAGAAFLADNAPYEFANPRGWKYAYPPLCALLLAPLAWLPTQTQALIWYSISCGLAWLTWREAVRISRHWGRDIRLSPENRTLHRRLGWIAVATVALPALNCLQRGQVGILNLWLLLWGLRLLVEAHSTWTAILGGVVLALPAVIKVTPALPAVMAVGVWSLAQWNAGCRKLATAAPAGLMLGGVLGLLVIPALFLGWSANWRHLQTWTTSILTQAVTVDPASTLETPYTVRNQNLSNAIYRAGNTLDHWLFGGPDDRSIDAVPFNPDHHLRMDHPAVGPTLLAVRLSLLGLLAVAGWRAGRSGERGELVQVFALACAASLIVAPLSRGHYFVLLLPAILWGSGMAVPRSPTWQRAVLLWTPLVVTLLHYAWLDVAGRLGVLGIGVTVWYVLAAETMLSRYSVGETTLRESESPPLTRAA